MFRRHGGEGHRLALAKDSAYVAMGRYSGLAAALITTPLYARAIGVAGMAQLAVAIGSGFVGSLLVDLGLTSPLAARVARGDSQLGALRMAYIKVRLYVGAVLVVVCATVWALPASTEVRLVAAGLVVGAASSIGEDWLLIGRRRYRALAISQVVARALLLVASGGLALGGELSVGLILLVTGVTNAIGGLITWKLTASDSARAVSEPDMRSTLSRLSLSYATSRLLSVTQSQAPTFVWGHAALPAVFGVFAGADKVFRATQSLTDALSVALLPRVSGTTGARRARYEAMGAALGVGLVLAALVAALAEPAVAVLLGNDFETSVTPLRILACALPGAAVFGTVTGSILIGLGHARLVVAANLLGALSVVVAVFATGLDAGPVEMAWAVVVSYTASGILTALIAALAINRASESDLSDVEQPKSAVAYLDHTSEPGGAELALRRTLDERPPWPWTLFVPPGSGEVWMGLPKASCAVLGPPQEVGAATSRGVRAPIRFGMCIVRMARALRTDERFVGARVVHANTTRSAIYGALAAHKGQALVVHLRDAVTPDSLGAIGWRVMRLVALRRADAVIANSAFVMSTAEPYLRDDVRREVIPSPIPVAVRAVKRDRTVEDAVRIVMLGRLADWKGVDLAIEAISLMSCRDRVELSVVGGSTLVSDPIEGELRDLATRLGVAELVHFIRQVPASDVPALIAGFDIGLQYSRRPEPMGQNVLQYLAAGLVVVAADEGGPREWLSNGVNGVLVNPREPSALARALDELVENPDLRAQLAAAAGMTEGIPRPAEVTATLGEFYVSLPTRRKGQS